ncbi:DUF2239 family protein [Acinetobacter sp. ULE_I010]|uniref:DUF2239 family protein n=1 Tax=Acinetobacter sp. ULE_I010 TaxID=3373065 RepID=UPI003AF851DC
MNIQTSYSAFLGKTHLITDSLLNVTLAIQQQAVTDQTILIFNDQTGQQIDIDTTGSITDIQQRYAEPEAVKKVGRPKLGVISREITLQQKHWDWLDQQSSSASAIIRKLIDAELNNPTSESHKMMAKQAVDRFMSAMLGDLPNYEEATRALYQGNKAVFLDLISSYPKDLKKYLVLKTKDIF